MNNQDSKEEITAGITELRKIANLLELSDLNTLDGNLYCLFSNARRLHGLVERLEEKRKESAGREAIASLFENGFSFKYVSFDGIAFTIKDGQVERHGYIDDIPY